MVPIKRDYMMIDLIEGVGVGKRNQLPFIQPNSKPCWVGFKLDYPLVWRLLRRASLRRREEGY